MNKMNLADELFIQSHYCQHPSSIYREYIQRFNLEQTVHLKFMLWRQYASNASAHSEENIDIFVRNEGYDNFLLGKIFLSPN